MNRTASPSACRTGSTVGNWFIEYTRRTPYSRRASSYNAAAFGPLICACESTIGATGGPRRSASRR